VSDAHNSDQIRFVIDESSFNFTALSIDDIGDRLDRFNFTLGELIRHHRVARADEALCNECLDNVPLYEYFDTADGKSLDRDIRLLFLHLSLNRCEIWDDSTPDLPDSVQIGTVEDECMALSVGYALHRRTQGFSVACIVFPDSRDGWIQVSAGSRKADLFFFGNNAATIHFWRSLYRAESIDEARFLDLVAEAFPSLVFCEGIDFRRFDGKYRDLRDHVVRALGAINDHFAQALADGNGIPDKVQSTLGQFHLDVSPESPKTRSSKNLMNHRNAEYRGLKFVCEWHAKIERHRNRIHFSIPDPRIGDKILIGHFVDHLPTEG